MTAVNRGSVNVVEPAVRKDFWEFLISLHPIEGDYARSTKNPYRWRRIRELRLVVVQFVSEYGVGVLVRGKKATLPMKWNTDFTRMAKN